LVDELTFLRGHGSSPIGTFRQGVQGAAGTSVMRAERRMAASARPLYGACVRAL